MSLSIGRLPMDASARDVVAGHPVHLAGVGHEPGGDAVIAVRGMSYRYPDGVLALEDINLFVDRGSTLAVIGPNGGGKTTLLHILVGLIEGYTGDVRVAGLPPRAARRQGNVVAWVSQRARFRWGFPVSVRDVVAMGLFGRTGMLGRVKRDDREYLERVLAVLQIDQIAGRPIGELSGGQQQRTLIARALVPRPQIVLLDEPGGGVDTAGKARLQEVLAEVRREFGVALVVVSHDLRMVVAGSQRVACLNRRLHFHDAPESLTPAVLDRLYACSLDGILPAACQHDEPSSPEP